MLRKGAEMLRKGAELLRLAMAWLRIASHCKGIGLISNEAQRNGAAMESKATQSRGNGKNGLAKALIWCALQRENRPRACGTPESGSQWKSSLFYQKKGKKSNGNQQNQGKNHIF